MFTKPCLIFYLFPLLTRFVTQLLGPVNSGNRDRSSWWKENCLCVICDGHNATLLHASIIFINWNWTAGSAVWAFLCFCFCSIFGETQCWQHGNWEKTNKTEIVVKHQIWEENYLVFQSSCPMCVMVDLEILPSWQISSLSDASRSHLRHEESQHIPGFIVRQLVINNSGATILISLGGPGQAGVEPLEGLVVLLVVGQ